MSSPYLDTLNKEQREAVLHTEGPLLILAGAGSGKTQVITHRIAYLIEECGVEPWNIMAITFTNKAAGEMRERAQHLIGAGADGLWVSTFHASCARILRRYADRIGYGTNYTIYDTDDTRSVMKEICKRLNLDRDRFKPREILNRISRSKDNGYDAQDYAAHVQGDSYRSVIAQAYLEYEKTLRNANAMDFDDLLLNTVRLLQRDEEVLTSYQNRFRYIMVDEYQDTNDIQFRLLELLAAGSRNLCVVGDDDQSIYRFRGANIRNILEFEQVYPDAFVVKLEQNYRSTQTILDAANAVIRNNEGRKDKRLWTEEGEGALIRLQSFSNAIEEARFIAQEVGSRKRAEHVRLSDMAVLYRTNAQSRLIEEFLVKEAIPYNLVGGTSFYTRREIRDLLAYLKTIECGTDDLSLLRIINVPRRGIGATTIGRLRDYAAMEEISLLAACEGADRIIALSKSAAEKCRSFAEQIREFRAFQMKAGLEQLLNHIIDTIGYEDYLNSIEAEEREDQVDRMENVNELLSKVADYESRAEEPSLAGFLEDVALVADIDELSEDQDRVLLMTLHSAKGLEFDHVFITGLEEGLFPSWPAVESEDDDPAAMEEERR
ncbi:MAG: UvrD-helicase domain-containing protein, partial [Butyrivibrio sp.]|nr:UvrD-helicase domain-containing protein [Butyrivibrio sp.]